MNVTKIVVFCLLWSNLVKVKFKCMQDKKPTFVLKNCNFISDYSKKSNTFYWKEKLVSKAKEKPADIDN